MKHGYFQLTCLLCAAAVPALAGPVYTFNTFTVGGANALNSVVTGINDAGDVTGYYSPSTGIDTGFVMLADGTISFVAAPGAFQQVLSWGINESDTVAAQENFKYNGVNSTFEGLVETLNPTTDVFIDGPDTSPFATYAFGVNDSGEAVGYYKNSFGSYSYTYSGSTMTQLADPGNSGTTQASGINDSGEVVGVYNTLGVQHGFLLDNGTYSIIDDPLGTHGTNPTSINAQGDIGGYYLDGVNAIHGFVYIAATQSYETIDLGAGGRTYIYGINDSDQISGAFRATSISSYTDFIGSPESATPEPSFMWLSAAVIAGLAVRRSHKK